MDGDYTIFSGKIISGGLRCQASFLVWRNIKWMDFWVVKNRHVLYSKYVEWQIDSISLNFP